MSSKMSPEAGVTAPNGGMPPALGYLLGIGGAVLGGLLGYFAFDFLLGYGLYAMMLPGALLGMGCGMASGKKSIVLGIVCGVAALALGVWMEWNFFPFIADKSLSFFMKNLKDVNTMHWVMIILGAIAGFWFGVGRERFAARRTNA